MMFSFLGMKLAWKLNDAFARYLVLGFTIVTTLQVIINCAVAIGMFPTKGIGLPFVSYGNSSLVCAIAFLGIIVRASREG
jgi:cell division protein FtsW